jgi:hypothetical protein
LKKKASMRVIKNVSEESNQKEKEKGKGC